MTKIDKLFITRGVPGTHDTKMLLQCIKNLKNKNFKNTNIPKFDKSTDDRLQKKKWLKVKKKPNIVIFEGWCVGAIAQKNKDLKFYGNLNIQEYRQLLKNERLLLIVEKPLTRMLPELHEDNDEFMLNTNYVQSSVKYKIRKNTKNLSKSDIVNENFNI